MLTRPSWLSITVCMRKPLDLRCRSSAAATSSLHAASAAPLATINRAKAVNILRIVVSFLIRTRHNSCSHSTAFFSRGKSHLPSLRQRRARVAFDHEIGRIRIDPFEQRYGAGGVLRHEVDRGQPRLGIDVNSPVNRMGGSGALRLPRFNAAVGEVLHAVDRRLIEALELAHVPGRIDDGLAYLRDDGLRAC